MHCWNDQSYFLNKSGWEILMKTSPFRIILKCIQFKNWSTVLHCICMEIIVYFSPFLLHVLEWIAQLKNNVLLINCICVYSVSVIIVNSTIIHQIILHLFVHSVSHILAKWPTGSILNKYCCRNLATEAFSQPGLENHLGINHFIKYFKTFDVDFPITKIEILLLLVGLSPVTSPVWLNLSGSTSTSIGPRVTESLSLSTAARSQHKERKVVLKRTVGDGGGAGSWDLTWGKRTSLKVKTQIPP